MTTTSTTIPGFVSGSSGYPTTYPISGSGGSSSSFGSTVGLGALAGSLVELLVILMAASLVGVVVIAIVASRSEPDPSGRRPQSVYFFVVSFVTLLTTIVGSALVVGTVLLLTAHESDSASHALDRLLLISILITAASGFLCSLHLRRGLTNARRESHDSGPSKRVGQSYVAVVAFVAVLVLLGSVILSVYVLFALAAPGTFGSFGGSSWATRALIESVYLGAVAAFVLWRHGRMLTPTFQLWGASGGGGEPPSGGMVGGVPGPGPAI